jgi:hypothetical protein
LGLDAVGDAAAGDSWFRYLGDEREGLSIGHYAEELHPDWLVVILFLVGPIVFPVAIIPLAARSLPAYLVAAFLGPLVVFWLPGTKLFSRRTRFYLYRPNDFIDAYDDPGSAHWLRSGLPSLSPG